MFSYTLRRVAAVVLTLIVTSCGDGNGTIPTATAPTPTPIPVSRSTSALFGVVSEVTANGIVPVEGVTIYVASCDAISNNSCAFDKRVTTDAQGSYIVVDVYSGPAGVYVEKTGFQLPVGVKVNGEGVQTVTIHGDTRLDVQLVRR